MLGWLRGKARCPVPLEQKDWIEGRLTWLVGEFGIDRLINSGPFLPTERYLPAAYECTEEGIHELMVLVARHMQVDPETLALGFFEDDTPEFEGVATHRAAGLYAEEGGKFGIWLEVNQLGDPGSVVATLAHEIGHAVLLGAGRVSPDENDQEELTDLLMVFLGLGIFPANSAVHEANWTDGNWSGWSVGKRGYLSMDMFGYALALYALARSERTPAWSTHLRLDARAALKKGIRYVLETGDCRFAPALRSTAS